MYETGRVTAVNGSSVTVSIQRKPACAECGMCGIGSHNGEMRVIAKNECNAVVNDRVGVSLETDAFFGAALILYGVPFIGFIAGVLLGYGVSAMAGFDRIAGLIGFLCGAAFTVPAFIIIKKLEPVWKRHVNVPVASRIELEDTVK